MTSPIHLLSARMLTPVQFEKVRAVSPRLQIRQVDAQTAADIDKALTPETEILFTSLGNFKVASWPGTQAGNQAGERLGLRWVQMGNAGIDPLHGTELWQSDIPVTSSNGAHLPHLPEYILSVILAWSHHLFPMYDYYRQAHWADGAERPPLFPVPLGAAPGTGTPRTLGIIGYGAIGRETARMAKALGMRVLATRRAGGSLRYQGFSRPGMGDPEGVLPDAYFTLEELPKLLQQSDYIVLLIPLTKETKRLINAAQLAQMQPHAVLINVGRGGLVDQNALIDAVQRKVIGGAVLDVTDPEPLPADHPLWRQPNLIITPHMSGYSPYYVDHVVDVFVENLRRYVEGEPLLNLVQRELGY